ncbi:DUF6020 family protein [Bacillaceae bacterium S4-13-56]
MVKGLAVVIAAVLSTVASISWFQSFMETPNPTIAIIFLIYIGIYWLFFRLLFEEWRELFHLGTVIFSMLFTLAFLTSIYQPMEHLNDNGTLVHAFIYVGTFVTFTLVSILLIYLFTKVNIEIKDKQVSKWNIAFYGFPMAIVGTLFLLGFFPGEMSPDSFSHWTQIHTHEYNNWHPVVYTWLIQLLTVFWYSPAVVGTFQIIALSLTLGYGLYRFQKAGVPRTVLWIVAILFAIHPATGMFSIILWKDILYSTALMLFTILLFNIVATRGAWLSSISHLVFFGLTALSMMFMRSNGVPILLLLIVLLLLVYRNQWKKLGIFAVSVFAIYFIVSGPVYSAFHVEEGDPNEALGIPQQQLARVVVEGGEMNGAQQQYVYKLLPRDKWFELYNPYLTDTIKFSGIYNKELIFSDFPYFLKVWALVVKNNPGLVIDAYLDQTSLVWQIVEPEDGYTNTYPGGIFRANTYGIKQTPVSDGLHEFLTGYLEGSFENYKEWFWRPATYTFFILFFSFIAVRKIGFRSLLVSGPVLLNTAIVAAAIPAQDYRYLFANTLIAFMIFLMALVKKEEEHVFGFKV